MAFFSKLRERLFKTSSKLEGNLEALVEEAEDAVDPAPEPEGERPGLISRLVGQGRAPTRVLDDDMLESLEEVLIQADLGVDTALKVSARMAEGRFGRRLAVSDIKALLAAEVAAILEPVARPMPLYPKRPQVVLVVGVNGSGKTTTIG
ncbi:MAG: signal recognition particle receptor subunit alpha, partial [Pseudomonadota bacterium]